MFHCGNNGALLVSRHHTLPPVVATPEPSKPNETRRKRGIGSVWRKRATDGSDEADEIDDGPLPAPAPRTSLSPPGTRGEATERHIPFTSGKLSADTLKIVLEAQEVTSNDGTQS
jgi:hypothetical protein